MEPGELPGLLSLAGAVLNVPWLALGTVYLLGGQAIG